MNTTIQGLQICAADTHLWLSSSSKSLNFKDSGQVGPGSCALSHGLQICRNTMHEKQNQVL